MEGFVIEMKKLLNVAVPARADLAGIRVVNCSVQFTEQRNLAGSLVRIEAQEHKAETRSRKLFHSPKPPFSLLSNCRCLPSPRTLFLTGGPSAELECCLPPCPCGIPLNCKVNSCDLINNELLIRAAGLFCQTARFEMLDGKRGEVANDGIK